MHISTDRRAFVRIEGGLAVRYSPPGSDREYCTTTKNISGGGIKIYLLKKLSPGTILNLEIFKNNSDISTKCRGEIIWTSSLYMKDNQGLSFEAGIKFIDSHLLHIGNLINDLETRNVTTHLFDPASY